MTSYGAKDIARSFRTVRANTIKAAEDIPEDKYAFSPGKDCRTVAQLLTHIAVTYRFQYTLHAQKSTPQTFDFQKLFGEIAAEEKKTRSKSEIVALLIAEGEKCASWLDTLSDEFLAERVELPHSDPPTKSRLEMLLSIKEHEMHHRGQVMLIERLIGIVPHLTRAAQERMAAATA